MSAHDHTTIVPGCYRCDLNRDEMPSPLEAAVDADEAYMDDHNNTVNGDSEERVLETLTAALDAADLERLIDDTYNQWMQQPVTMGMKGLFTTLSDAIRDKILGGTRG